MIKLQFNLIFLISSLCFELSLISKTSSMAYEQATSKIFHYCEGEKLFLTGGRIRFSKIIENGRIKVSSFNCSNPTTKIYIFAFNVVEIDSNLKRHDSLEFLCIVAPTWSIIGKERIIDLKGKNGSNGKEGVKVASINNEYWLISEKPLERIISQSYLDDEALNLAARHGSSGTNGTVGANFLGIGDSFLNGKSLTVKVDGGNGGNGGHGGNGVKGPDGWTAIDNDVVMRLFCEYVKCNKKYANEVHMADRYFLGFEWVITWHELTDNGDRACWYELKADKGIQGQRGGNGGDAGLGAAAGIISMTELGYSSHIVKSNRAGSHGTPGKGGKGGIGGKNGKHCGYLYSDSDDPMKGFEKRKKFGCPLNIKYYRTPIEYGPDGERGSDGDYMSDKTPIQRTTYISELITVLEYKSYFRLYASTIAANNPSYFKETDDFFKAMDQYSESNFSKVFYNTDFLLKEFKQMELQFNSLKENFNFYPYYQSLLTRIEQYAQKRQEDERNDSYTKVLVYLFTATVGRVKIFERRKDQSLILNIDEYLKTVKKGVDEVIDMQLKKDEMDHNKLKIRLIEEHNKNYVDGLEGSIASAESCIESVQGEIDSINQRTNDEVKKWIQEIVDLQNDKEEQIEELKEKKEKAKDLVIIQGILSGLTVMGSIVSLFPGPTQAVGVALTAGAGIAKSIIPKPEAAPTLPKLPEGVKNLNNGIQKLVSLERDRLIYLLDTIKGYITECSKPCSGLLEPIDTLRTKTRGAKQFAVIQNIRKELADFVKELRKKSKYKRKYSLLPAPTNGLLVSTEDGEKDIALITFEDVDEKYNKMAEKVEKRFAVPSKVFEFGMGIKENVDLLDRYDDAIGTAYRQLKDLQEAEDRVREVAAESITNMQDDLNLIIEQFKSKPMHVLDVEKWRVGSMIDNMSDEIGKMAKDFNVEEDLLKCFKKLKDAMNTIIELHKSTKFYQGQIQQANFYTDIAKADLLPFDFNKTDLEKEVNYLSVIVKSNIIMEYYRIGIDAFRNNVFPFFGLHQSLKMPEYLNHEIDRQQLIQNAHSHIDALLESRNSYNIQHNDLKAYVFSGPFSSPSKPPDSFFKWRNVDNKFAIEQLLSGKNITLFSDVQRTRKGNYFAIKFKTVILFVKTIDETKQKKLYSILKNFMVTLVHSGFSYFLYDQKVYLINTHSSEFSYRFPSVPNNSPRFYSANVKSFSSNDYILSPYTYWTINIEPFDSSYDYLLPELQQFVNEVNLELRGEGQAVKRSILKSTKVNVKIDEYYTSVNSKYLHNEIDQ